MPEEIAGLRRRDVLRWVVIAAVLITCLVAYFAYAPEVRPPLAPSATEP
jgi:hypothetical protein